MCNVRYHMFIYYHRLFIQGLNFFILSYFWFLLFFVLVGLAGFRCRQCKLSGARGQALLAGSQPGRVVSLEGRLRVLRSQ